MRHKPLLLIACLVMLTPMPAMAEVQVKTFSPPMVRGKPADYCYAPGQGCGEVAARAFCKSKGYNSMAGFSGTPVAKTSYVGVSGGCTANMGGAVIGGAVSCKDLAMVKCQKKVFSKEIGIPNAPGAGN